jgi:hypothetical protein
VIRSVVFVTADHRSSVGATQPLIVASIRGQKREIA